MKKTLITFFAILVFNVAKSQMNVVFDFSNIDQTISFLKKEKVTNEDIVKMTESAGVKNLIRKIQTTDSVAKTALINATQDIKGSGKEESFQYAFIKRNLTELEKFSNLLKAKQKIIIDSIQSISRRLKHPTNAKIVFLLGGPSSGFTFQDKDVLYIGIHHYQSDFYGILNVCRHELFHLLQNQLFDQSQIFKKLEIENDLSSLYAYYFAQNLFVEGSAEFIVDIEKENPDTPFIKEQLAHNSVNKYRMKENFYLVDRLIVDAFLNNKKIDDDAVYNIMFSWNWNNPGYQVGKWMTQELTKAYGLKIIDKYLESNPMLFVKDYLDLTKKKGTMTYRFSEEFEKIINTVSDKIILK